MEEKQWKETAASDGSGKKSWNLKVVMHCPKCGGTKLGLKGHHLARRAPEDGDTLGGLEWGAESDFKALKDRAVEDAVKNFMREQGKGLVTPEKQ